MVLQLEHVAEQFSRALGVSGGERTGGDDGEEAGPTAAEVLSRPRTSVSSAPLRGRLQDCQSMNFHFLADALQIFVVTRDRATLKDLADTRRFCHRIGDANFVDIGGTLYARRNIHVLSEVIDPVIEPHGDGPSSMHTDL